MSRLIGLITGNPWVLVWIAAGAFALGVASGGGVAWKVQGWRLEAVRAEFAGFTATVKAQGEAAEKLAVAQAAEDKRKKESSDHEYKIALAALTADNQRMRDERARRGYVPAAPASSQSPDLACFDRIELEQALRRFDEGITGIIAEGDAGAVALNSAREWARTLRTSPH
jgi:hypothetical protein